VNKLNNNITKQSVIQQANGSRLLHLNNLAMKRKSKSYSRKFIVTIPDGKGLVNLSTILNNSTI